MRASRLLTAQFLGYIAARDLVVMRRCNNWIAPRWIRLWMICATRGGDGWFWYGVGVLTLVFGGPDRFRATGAAFLAAAAGIWLFLLLKKTANRSRPCAISRHAWATLLPPDQFSFPSGHTMTAFAVSTPIMHYYPDLSAVLMFCSVSIAVSRIVLGMHFLSDVVAGGLLGVLLGVLSAAII
ncbi:MAG TPA: phosphatase PAP2 family protein [Bryobacteraceae bacterium]|nr:phosphatase PAP2 family protein [Bryobacteraceae bacterium]